MLELNVGRREQNRVLQKLKILDAFLDAMTNQKLHELNIEDVCKTIDISKVTFFNYFKTKEEVVEYFIQLWQFEVSFEIGKSGLKGEESLYFIVDNVSNHPAGQSIILALTAFFIKTDSYVPTQVSEYELYVYNEKAYLEGYRSVPLYNLLKVAIDELGITGQAQNVLVANFMCGFYGVPLVYGLGLGQSLNQMYHDHLANILPDDDKKRSNPTTCTIKP